MAEANKLKDALLAAQIVLQTSWQELLRSWVYVPIGVIIVLYACVGITALVGIGHVTFPASVAVMILLFLFLLLSEAVIGDRRTRTIVKLVEIPGGFSLRFINALFCPAFVLIPLAPPISSVEVGKIIAVFVIGYLIVFAFTAYLTRGLILLFGISKRAMTERAEELGARRDSIPLTEIDHDDQVSTQARSLRTDSQAPLLSANEDEILQEPTKAHDPSDVTRSGGPSVPLVDDAASLNAVSASIRPSRPKTRPERWAALVSARLDLWTYAFLFFAVGLPVFFTIDYAMPAQLTVNVLCYFAALALPAPWRRIAHPAIVASILTIVGIYILAMCHGEEFTTELQAYQTKTTYLQILTGKTGLPKPGAGDVLSSILQVSIVALALPMYQNRQELKRSFFPIVIPSISIAIASLFGYPFICHAMGISPSRSLAFPSRSLTLALATPATVNLGGDLSAVAVLCILSGILGVIIGPQLLNLLRVPEDDYITRGVTLGANSSAIATALLLVTDPRAAAFSSLAMGLFGTITVAFTSVPAIASVVKHLAGA